MNVLVANSWKGTYHILRPEIELFKQLQCKGVTIQFVTDAQTPIAKQFKKDGFKVHDLDFTSKFSIKKSHQLRQIIIDENIDIVHAIYNKYVANAIRAVRGLPVKLVAYRGAVINWLDPTNYLTFLHPRIDAIICLSNAVQQSVTDSLKFWKTPTVQIYKGQDCNWFKDVKAKDKKTFSIPPHGFMVSLASSVRKVKGVEYLIAATEFMPPDLPIYFLLAGSGTDSKRMTQLVDSLNNRERIKLLGHRDDVLSIMKASDCYVLPTIGTEGLSRSIIEAMCLNVPVISTKSGGPEEIITHEKNGLLVPRKNAKAIADAILKLYHHKKLRETFAKEGKKTISQSFSVEQNAAKTFSLYQYLLTK